MKRKRKKRPSQAELKAADVSREVVRRLPPPANPPDERKRTARGLKPTARPKRTAERSRALDAEHIEKVEKELDTFIEHGTRRAGDVVPRPVNIRRRLEPARCDGTHDKIGYAEHLAQVVGGGGRRYV